MTEGNFNEHKLMILGDIARQNVSLMKLQDIVTALAIKVGQLEVADKIRASLWGGLAGFITASALIALAVILEKVWK